MFCRLPPRPAAYVNDPRVVRDPGDIKNPIGVKNSHDVARIDDNKNKDPKDNKNTTTKTKNGNPEGSESGKRTTVTLPSKQNWEKERKSTEIKKSPANIPANQQYSRQDPYNGKEPSVRYDKDSQFQRNSSKSYQKVSPYRTFNSPYYRDGNAYGDDGRKTLVFPIRTGMDTIRREMGMTKKEKSALAILTRQGDISTDSTEIGSL